MRPYSIFKQSVHYIFTTASFNEYCTPNRDLFKYKKPGSRWEAPNAVPIKQYNTSTLLD